MSFRTLTEHVLGLCNDVLGEEVLYTPNGDSEVTINGVFDNAYVDVEGVVSLKPVLRIQLSDLAALPGKGDTAEVNSVNYSVTESRLDGHGGTTLILKKI
jgi:hypothetical protein